MIRNRTAYKQTYDANAANYLKAWKKYYTDMAEGSYEYENSFLPMMFSFCFYNYYIFNTKSKIANDVLDKIITQI